MGWGFRKVLRIGKFGRVTIGKKSVGASVGIGPLRFGVNSKGTTRTRVTIPKTGLYYEERGHVGAQEHERAREDLPTPKRRLATAVGVTIVLLVLAALFLAHVL